MVKSFVWPSFFFIFCSCAFSNIALGIEQIQYLNMLTHEMLEILQRGENLADLCSSAKNEQEYNSCKEHQLQPEEWNINLYSRPSKASSRIGQINFRITPGKDVTLNFQSPDGKFEAFTVDEASMNLAYEAYLYQSIVQKKGSWVQLPANPFPQAVWMDINAPRGEGLGLKHATRNVAIRDALKPHIIYILKKDLKVSNKNEKTPRVFPKDTSIILLQVTKQIIKFRQEISSDIPCSSKLRPSQEKPSTFSTDAKSFLDVDGHLILKKKYPLGC